MRRDAESEANTEQQRARLLESADTCEACVAELEEAALANPEDGPTAGDLLIRAADSWDRHANHCDIETCAACDVVVNQFRLALKVWQNSAHQSATRPADPEDAARPADSLTVADLHMIASVLTDHADQRADDEDQPDGQHDAAVCRAIARKAGIAAARPVASAVPQEWQSIDTAPKHGPWFPAKLADGTEMDVSWAPFDGWRDRQWRRVQPTHWKSDPPGVAGADAVPPHTVEHDNKAIPLSRLGDRKVTPR